MDDTIEILQALKQRNDKLSSIITKLLPVIQIWECTECTYKIVAHSIDQIECPICDKLMTPVLSRRVEELQKSVKSLEISLNQTIPERDHYLTVLSNLLDIIYQQTGSKLKFSELENFFTTQHNYIKILENSETSKKNTV